MAKLSSTQIYGDLQVDGEIKNKASTTSEGVVQLNDEVSSTSTTQGATANAVKKVNDSLSSHKTDTTSHITASERTTWNGKLDKSGGTVTGGLTVNGAINVTLNAPEAIKATKGNHVAMMGCSTTAGDFLFGGGPVSTGAWSDYIRVGANKLIYKTNGTEYKIYHTGNKPTPADIGASPTSHTHSYLPLSGGAVTGNITFDNDKGVYCKTTSGDTYTIARIRTDNEAYFGTVSVPLALASKTNPRVNVNNTYYTLYHTGNKPTPTDIGASPTSGSTSLSQLASNVVFGDANAFTITQNGGSWWQKLGTADTTDLTVHRLFFSERQGSGDYVELFGVDGNGDIYAKNRKVYHTGNKPTASDVGALSLSGGTLTGSISSSLTTTTHLEGNKGKAIINSTASGTSYNMLAKMNSTNGVWTLGSWGQNFNFYYTANSTITEGTNTVTKTLTLLNESGNSVFPGTVTAPTFSGALSGNASTATKLQTARTINGTSFNGSANITTANWGTARTITIGKTGKSVNGSGNVSWSLAEIGAIGQSGTGSNGEVFNDYTYNVASGEYSHAEGNGCTASSYGAHAEGYQTTASGGTGAHAEGMLTRATSGYAHAEGVQTTASGQASHSEGWTTQALGLASHAEGDSTIAYNGTCHAEGFQCVAGMSSSLSDEWGAHAEGYKTTATGQGSHAEGYNCKAQAMANHAEGWGAIASGQGAHAEGSSTTASGSASHAEGGGSKSSGSYSHAEGYYTEASGQASHAEGLYSIASGRYSHAGGYECTAKGSSSFATGEDTTAETYACHVIGRFNKVNSGSATSHSSTQNAFVIGNGTSTTAKSNAFRVNFSGQTYGLSAFNSTGADYAEYFEWLDGNPNNEDRIGLFVTLDGEKIRLANSEDDYIIGIISGNQSIIGNACEDGWNDMYLRDEFGRLQYEDVEVEKEVQVDSDKLGEEKKSIEKVVEKHIKLNPNYDPSVEYKPRSERKEWGIVGMLGQIILKDDGTCKVNGYCKPSENGIATASDDNAHYRVMSRISDNLIKVIMR